MNSISRILWIAVGSILLIISILITIWWNSAPRNPEIQEEMIMLIVDKLLIATLIATFAFVGQKLLEKYKATQGIREEFAKQRLLTISTLTSLLNDIQTEILLLNDSFIKLMNDEFDKTLDNDWSEMRKRNAVAKKKFNEFIKNKKKNKELKYNEDEIFPPLKVLNEEDLNKSVDEDYQNAVDKACDSILPRARTIQKRLEKVKNEIAKSYFWTGNKIETLLVNHLAKLIRLNRNNTRLIEGEMPKYDTISELVIEVRNTRLNVDELLKYL